MIEIKQHSVKMAPLDVMCPKCRAPIDSPCVGQSGDHIKTPHPERMKFRDYFVDKAEGTSDTARWWRHKLRTHGPTTPKMNHGTQAGYAQHLRRKEKACEPCLMANRAYVNERKRIRRQQAKEAK